MNNLLAIFFVGQTFGHHAGHHQLSGREQGGGLRLLLLLGQQDRHGLEGEVAVQPLLSRMHRVHTPRQFLVGFVFAHQARHPQVNDTHDIPNRCVGEHHRSRERMGLLHVLQHFPAAALGQGHIHHQHIRTVLVHGRQGVVTIARAGLDLKFGGSLEDLGQSFQQHRVGVCQNQCNAHGFFFLQKMTHEKGSPDTPTVLTASAQPRSRMFTTIAWQSKNRNPQKCQNCYLQTSRGLTVVSGSPLNAWHVAAASCRAVPATHRRGESVAAPSAHDQARYRACIPRGPTWHRACP